MQSSNSSLEFSGQPIGLLIAEPNAFILYSTIGRAPKLSFEDQLNILGQTDYHWSVDSYLPALKARLIVSRAPLARPVAAGRPES